MTKREGKVDKSELNQFSKEDLIDYLFSKSWSWSFKDMISELHRIKWNKLSSEAQEESDLHLAQSQALTDKAKLSDELARQANDETNIEKKTKLINKIIKLRTEISNHYKNSPKGYSVADEYYKKHMESDL